METASKSSGTPEKRISPIASALATALLSRDAVAGGKEDHTAMAERLLVSESSLRNYLTRSDYVLHTGSPKGGVEMIHAARLELERARVDLVRREERVPGIVLSLHRSYIEIYGQELALHLARAKSSDSFSLSGALADFDLSKSELLDHELLPTCDKCIAQLEDGDSKADTAIAGIQLLKGRIYNERRDLPRAIAAFTEAEARQHWLPTIQALAESNKLVAEYEQSIPKRLSTLLKNQLQYQHEGDTCSQDLRLKLLSDYRAEDRALDAMSTHLSRIGKVIPTLVSRLNALELASDRLNYVAFRRNLGEECQDEEAERTNDVRFALNALVTVGVQKDSVIRSALSIQLYDRSELAWLRRQPVFADWCRRFNVSRWIESELPPIEAGAIGRHPHLLTP